MSGVSFPALRAVVRKCHALAAACHRIAAIRGVALAATVLSATGSAAAQTPSTPEVKPPAVVEHVDAVYPASALTEGKHATVILTVTVDAQGHVSKIEVGQSGGADLDEAATVAARQWLFTPAMRGDKPVASRIRVPFHFAPPAPEPEIVEPPPGETPTLPATRAVEGAPSQPKVGAAAPSGTPESETGEVEVLGRKEPPNRGASDFNLRVGELARIPRGDASELLKLAPGILLTNEGGEGHAEQVFLRGFDAREGQDIEFTVGGVPINESGNQHGNGYADTHFIIPELVETLRVVEGPFDPRQGNYAVAGSADYELGLPKRGLTAKYTAGSFDTQRGLLMWGPNGQSERTFAGAEVYSTAGFGQNRDATRATAMAQYEGRLGQRGSYRVTATGYSTHYHSAGVLRDDDFRAGRVGFFDTYDSKQGGDSSRFSLAADLSTRVGATTFEQQVFLIRRGMRLRENFTGYLLDVQQPLDTPPHDQRGDLLDLLVGETTYGARGYARLSGTLWGQPQQLEFGYFARGDDVTGTQQRIFGGQINNPYKTDANLASTLGDFGLYADAEIKLLSWIALRGGLRTEVLTYDVTNLCAVTPDLVDHPSLLTNGASCLTQRDFGVHVEPNLQSATASSAVLPRASMVIGPIDGFSLSASYGQGIRSVDPGYITQDLATPFASIVAYEGGVSYARTLRDFSLVVRSIGFQTHVDKSLIFSENAGRNVLGVGTTRTGWVAAVRATGPWLDASANATFVKATFDDTHLLVPYVPDVVVRSDTALYSNLPMHVFGNPLKGALSAGITYVGPRALPFGERSNDIFTIDTSATLAWSNYELGLIVTNLLDNRYRLSEYNYASDFHSQSEPTLVPVRHFAAGAPRGVFATFAATFGGA
jgi:iron complex outermembrane recepter protein